MQEKLYEGNLNDSPNNREDRFLIGYLLSLNEVSNARIRLHLTDFFWSKGSHGNSRTIQTFDKTKVALHKLSLRSHF